MSLILIRSLTKCLIDTIIAIEFNDDLISNEDMAVGLLEQISAELQTLSEVDKNTLINEIAHLSREYPKDVSLFVKNLPESIGIADA